MKQNALRGSADRSIGGVGLQATVDCVLLSQRASSPPDSSSLPPRPANPHLYPKHLSAEPLTPRTSGDAEWAPGTRWAPSIRRATSPRWLATIRASGLALMGLFSLMGLLGAIGVVAAFNTTFGYYLLSDIVWPLPSFDILVDVGAPLFGIGVGGLVATVWIAPARFWAVRNTAVHGLVLRNTTLHGTTLHDRRRGASPVVGSTLTGPGDYDMGRIVRAAGGSMDADTGGHTTRRIDYALIVVTSVVVEFLCGGAALEYHWDPLPLFLCTLVAYATGLALLIVTVARLRDRQLGNSISWTHLWKIYPIATRPGAVMALLGLGTLVGVVVNMATVVSDWIHLWEGSFRMVGSWVGPVLMVILLTLGFAGLTWLNTFLGTSAERADRVNAEKVRAERFKAELLANVSHDVRTPLTSIINYVDLLKAIPDQSEQAREYIGVLDRKSARLKTLLSDLIEASKLTTGHVSSVINTVDLTEIVGQVAGEWDDQFADHGLTLVFRQPEESVHVNADSNHLWRVLENLFSNAAKYALPGTRVFSDITVEPDAVTYQLKNTSADPIDLPPDALTEQFIRGDRSRHTDGNGLGLYIARSLAEAMAASLTIRADGDLFEASLELPVADVLPFDTASPTLA